MNIKLLKELYYQAETECGWSEEKFAELIVMECTKILADNSEFRSCVIIGKHFRVFGVEE